MVSPARYKIILHKKVVEEDSRRFDATIKGKIKEKCIQAFSFQPDQVGEPLRKKLSHYRKLMVLDDYRVIYRVDRHERKVFILAVGMRRNEEVYQEALRRL
ncbi:MAG: type II toxin-antitoxin system RelE/ParE family toxin [Candidatus Omnitrophica bacterium]|nr:type II toxin-antitoxin system RelE/ParE family toxin [Candidatus Omnitrophota bacterium]